MNLHQEEVIQLASNYAYMIANSEFPNSSQAADWIETFTAVYRYTLECTNHPWYAKDYLSKKEHSK